LTLATEDLRPLLFELGVGERAGITLSGFVLLLALQLLHLLGQIGQVLHSLEKAHFSLAWSKGAPGGHRRQSNTAFSTATSSALQPVTAGALPSAVSGSFNPWPVSTQTTVSG
jgi:hypothetical protein